MWCKGTPREKDNVRKERKKEPMCRTDTERERERERETDGQTAAMSNAKTCEKHEKVQTVAPEQSLS